MSHTVQGWTVLEWTQGSELGVKYDQVYEILVEGLHEVKGYNTM